MFFFFFYVYKVSSGFLGWGAQGCPEGDLNVVEYNLHVDPIYKPAVV